MTMFRVHVDKGEDRITVDISAKTPDDAAKAAVKKIGAPAIVRKTKRVK